MFIAGLCNSLPRQVARNWNREEDIRIHFGPVLDFSEYLVKRDHVRTYKEISEFVMKKIAELGEEDREIYGGEAVGLPNQKSGGRPPS